MLEVVAPILATVAAVATAVGLRSSARVRALTALASVAAASAVAITLAELGRPLLVLPFGLSCLMLGLIVGTAREQRDDMAVLELQRHLARCRRRGDTASALVVALPEGAPMRKDLAETLRITDSAAVRRIGSRWELNAILDADDVPRPVVEERLVLALAASDPVFGWASFPADGLTLEALFDQARSRVAKAVPVTAPRPAEASSRAPDDPAPAT